MGFSYYEYGHIKPCGVSNGMLYYTLKSGVRVTHKTSLKVDLKEQTNMFISETVAFYLMDQDNMYIGRDDGSISIYRKSDELLVGLGNWEKPNYVETRLCGYFKVGKMLNEIHIDMRDRRTLYVCVLRSEACLDTPIEPRFSLNDSAFCTSIFGRTNDYAIFDERGDPIAAKFWPIQEDIRSQNCRVFL